MTIGWREQLRPGVALREIVAQATASLISMDTERLEELALCCADLNRGEDKRTSAISVIDAIDTSDAIDADFDPRHALEQAAMDLKLLDRVLYETRANLTVLSRLHAIRLREIQALQPSLQGSTKGLSDSEWPRSEESYGDN